MDFSNMEVTIDHIAGDGSKIKAYTTVTFDGSFQVHGIRLAESKKGLNICSTLPRVPARKSMAHTACSVGKKMRI